MRVAIFSTRPHDRAFLGAANDAAGRPHDLMFLDARLTVHSAAMAEGADAVCAFVNDELDAAVLAALAKRAIRFVVLRSAGFNHVDLPAAAASGLCVARVPAYSPHAIAEHTLALILSLNRRIHKAYNRVREGNFALDGLLGFDLRGRTVGIVGTGQIGLVVARILTGFGCRLLGSDPHPESGFEALGGRYVPVPDLLGQSDIVTLHCPLTPATRHLIDEEAIRIMKPGVMLINTGRGALVDTTAVIDGLKRGAIGYLGLDVYEEEEGLFFEDLSGQIIQDDVFARLLTFPNVLITGHQGFFTADALEAIAATTIANLTSFETHGTSPNLVSAPMRA